MLPPLPVPLGEEPVTNTSSFVTTARVKLVHWSSSCWHKQLSFVGCRNILRIACISCPPLHEDLFVLVSFPALGSGEKASHRIYHGADTWSHLVCPAKSRC